MSQAYIVDAVRTPVGRRGGGLAGAHPVDLAAHVIRTLIGRNDFDPAMVDDVILGCLDTIGAQSGDIARIAALGAGLPESVPGVTVDRQCGSSQQAVHFAAQAVMSGTADIVVAGGVQNMSQIPLMSSVTAGEPYGATDPYSGSKTWTARYGGEEISQFRGAELIARQWNFDRSAMEAYALESHRRAVHALEQGYFDAEIEPFDGVSVDECPRPATTAAKMAALPTLTPQGRLTAAVSSQISDGASGMLIASESAVNRFDLTPRARVHHMSVLGADPIMMLTAPIPATRRALDRCGLSIDQIDAYEVNEAFAPVAMAWLHDIGADPERLNPHGGAIALGHPIGATGTRLMTTLLHELERTGGRYGLQAMCEGGGQANVTIIERLG
ncbi:acetyl-CoA C-acetyltransferase [Rhodococcus koreensis]|uniref:acetyl-CoA C-acetyltransferase n=1 Tax=Rhodococcus koreensis TaxID=99653 RepID=UPI00366D079A